MSNNNRKRQTLSASDGNNFPSIYNSAKFEDTSTGWAKDTKNLLLCQVSQSNCKQQWYFSSLDKAAGRLLIMEYVRQPKYRSRCHFIILCSNPN